MQPETSRDFAAALLAPDAPVPQNVVDPAGRIAPKRFSVYRNNVTVSLIEALRATFPAVLALVGDAFFDDMARRFVRQTPPSSPLLFKYGGGFAAFISAHEPAAGLPFLADVARLDRAWLDAYHSADATPFPATALAGAGEAELMAAQFTSMPATRLVASRFPLVTIWQAARNGQQPQLADQPDSEWALVTRPDYQVGVVALTPSTGKLLSALMAGKSLGEATETVLESAPELDLVAALGLIVSGGAFAGVTISAKE